MRKGRVFFCFLVCFAVAANAFGTPLVLEHFLGENPGYVREIGPIDVETASPVDIYVENLLEPLRWKEWYIEIWLLDNAVFNPVMNVDYHLTQDRTDVPYWVYDVALIEITGDDAAWGPKPAGMKGYYADSGVYGTANYIGTTPEGSGQGIEIGNPAWVSFHFNEMPSPFIYYIYDECIPEPATMSLLVMGGMLLFLKRK